MCNCKHCGKFVHSGQRRKHLLKVHNINENETHLNHYKICHSGQLHNSGGFSLRKMSLQELEQLFGVE